MFGKKVATVGTQRELSGLSDLQIRLIKTDAMRLMSVGDAERRWWLKRGVRPQDYDGYLKMYRELRGVRVNA